MSFFTNHFAAAPVPTPAPATIITPGPVGVPAPYETIGANGPAGPNGVAAPIADDSDSDGLPEIPLTFDQEQNLLMKMNEQQAKTIEELMVRIKALEKELVEKPVPAMCYIKCDHCKDK